MIPDLKKIAYIEDDQNLQLIAKFAFVKMGKFDLQIYSSGREALDALPKFMPDLILLDAILPDMDGVMIFQQLKASALCSSIPVMFLTALNGREETAELEALGAMAVLKKPFDVFSICQKIFEKWNATRLKMAS